MSCMLRIGGGNFDVDAIPASNRLMPDSVWRKGAERFPDSKTIKKVNESSGVRFIASDADMSKFEEQIEETIAFIRENQSELGALINMPGVDFALLDFGCEIYPPGWSSFTFPSELVSLAGSIGASLCVSVYPTDKEDSEDI